MVTKERIQQAVALIQTLADTEMVYNDNTGDLECPYCLLACHREYTMRPSQLDHDKDCPIRLACLWLQELPETIIVQGGTCWACGQWGKDMQWWHVGLYGDDGKMHLNKRVGYLIHHDSKCTRLAEQKVMTEKLTL